MSKLKKLIHVSIAYTELLVTLSSLIALPLVFVTGRFNPLFFLIILIFPAILFSVLRFLIIQILF